MSAPDKIWIDRGPNGGWMKRFERMPDSKHCYIRSDLATSEADELRAKVAELEAAIKRQAGAAKTLREITLAEVQHIKDADQKEYVATRTLDSERDANAILTDEIDELRAECGILRTEKHADAEAIGALREALEKIIRHCQNSGAGNALVNDRIYERCEDTARAALTKSRKG